ncbi:MAG: DNA polymerase II large subunit [Methanoregula sp. PtaU1.Bin006]|uniref:DNA-directed DNA polymerase II large subunit n=1 Tax=Methanoregula sp. PtaU1.Bin006 TaxID=1811681 RepID=UPI0009CD0DAB|nr:DNA-directed DNA polymerase II large subunit [Methanoregula sp. PtaU1.Bin006]OPY35015.1 MAG: DNA polymerase II large subunit [Methanoregula sp. PtaU1.Bin006]
MLKLSPAMQAYEKSLLDELHRAIAIAKEARKKGLDPSLDVEIPIASDLADRVEVLIGVKGVAARIRELEATMSREEAALRIGDDFVARKFGEKDTMEVLDHAIRVAMALLTEGVVSAPTEGIAKVALGKNDDGTQYLMIFYAGPIRSAGGTAQAMSVLVGDYVRQKLGINRYIPRQEEVERYVEEIRQYNNIMNLQYLPSEAEIRLIIENCPVCIDGEATEQEEVSGHRNLERVETNVVRGGMALVIGEGIAGKARKLKGRVEKMKMSGWDWLDKLIAGAAKGGDGEKAAGIKPLDKYLRDLIGGRPVFSYPMRKGGFRLRYGRSRNTGFAAAGIHPATLYVLGEFLATGTQMKTERPGKACGVVPVDSIEGPTVRLKNGDVLRISDEATAKRLNGKIEKILDVGEILISYGEFLENNHPLVPAGYCAEWWQLDAGDGVKPPKDEEEALAMARAGGYLYPEYTWFWDDITSGQIRALADSVASGGSITDGVLRIPPDPAVKASLELLLIPHTVLDNGSIEIRTWHAFAACLGLDDSLKKRDAWNSVPTDAAPLDLVMHVSGLKMRSRSGTRIGGRMGRPGKSKPRKMNPPPHVLFPLGDSGGARRSFQSASAHTAETDQDNTDLDFQKAGGIIEIEVGRRRCSQCGETGYLNRCEKCGGHTDAVFTCTKCGRETTFPRCPGCDAPATCSQRLTLDVKTEYAKVMERLGLKTDSVALVKGVKGVISKEKTVEAMEKGILRATRNIWVFKDGTTRFDMIDLPLTHIRPGEVRVPVEKLRELGYTKDTRGYDLQNSSQVVELHPQDILVSDSCAEYMVSVAQFIDDLLVKCYGLESFYNVKCPDDLVGHLVIGLAPHTSAGVLARIVGFTRANVGYAHPFFHAAKRRNCFFGDTEIEVMEGRRWTKIPIRKFVMENFDLSRPGIDRLGTYYSDPARPFAVRTVDTNGMIHIRKVTSVSIHRSPAHLLRIMTGRGRELVVTPDHAMLVWDTSYLRKLRAMELKAGDAVPVFEGTCVMSDRVAAVEPVPAPEERVYCLTVDTDHTLVANGIFTGQCDGDEDCIMLLLDGLINFSRSFLPQNRGGSMDAPLVLTSRIDPSEIDKEALNVDVCDHYPLEVYTGALAYAEPKSIVKLIDRVESRVGTEASVEGFQFTHDTSDISAGPLESMYTQMKTMTDKLEAELTLAGMIRAVDADDVAERVLTTHFLRDLMGNLSAFSKQKFRCTKCNTSYRRMPLAGKCTKFKGRGICNGNIIPTVHEGSVKKYLEMSREMCRKYNISEYTKQRMEVLDLAITSTFGEEKQEQLGLADFM